MIDQVADGLWRDASWVAAQVEDDAAGLGQLV